LRVTFELTVEDIRVHNTYYITQTKSGRRAVRREQMVTAGWLSILALLLARYSMPEWKLAGAISGIVLAGLICGAIILGRKPLTNHMIRRSVRAERKQAPLGKPMSIALVAEGISVQTDVLETTYLWRANMEIVSWEDVLLFQLDEVNTILVPARAFATADEFQAFADLARKLLQEAASGSPNNQPEANADAK